MQPTQHLKEFLTEVNMYDEFMSEIQTHHGITDIDDLTKIPFISNRFPGYFISESFLWSLSVTNKGKKAYPTWKMVQVKWLEYIKDHSIPDLSEFWDVT